MKGRVKGAQRMLSPCELAWHSRYSFAPIQPQSNLPKGFLEEEEQEGVVVAFLRSTFDTHSSPSEYCGWLAVIIWSLYSYRMPWHLLIQLPTCTYGFTGGQ